MATQFNLGQFIDTHRLPQQYAHTATHWFIPSIERIITHQRRQQRPLVIGINGAQGSGKSTLSALIAEYAGAEHNISAAVLSIDDFYLTKAQRLNLAKNCHPLLATRGVPGSHDIGLAQTVLAALTGVNGEVAVPRFNKASDDREPEQNWERYQTPLQLIILEGWCVGATAVAQEELEHPINALEANEDSDGSWRRYINRQLGAAYADLFNSIDCWLMLKAPSFDCVFNWRLEQEQKLRDKLATTKDADTSGLMNSDQVSHFIKHYQRVTEQCLRDLPAKVNFLYTLDHKRQISSLTQPVALK